MKNQTYVQAFLGWVGENQPLFDACRVTVHLPERISKNNIFADFFSDFGEATVELWNNGLSDIHISDSNADDVRVTHYEFHSTEELFEIIKSVIEHLENQNIPLRPQVAKASGLL